MNELTRLVPPPANPARFSAPDTPADYQALLERYGPGTLAGLMLLVPGHPNEFVDMTRQTERQRWALRTLLEQGIEVPYAPESLLPWGIDEAGNVVWWLTEGDWPVVALEARGEGAHRFDGTAAEFLVAILSGRFESEFLVIEGDDFEPL